MKAIHTREFWMKNRDRYSNSKTIDPEKDLAYRVRFLDSLDLPESEKEQVRHAVTKTEAQNVYGYHRKQLLERCKVVERAQKDPNCLGYTTQIQTVSALRDLVYGFELDCFILSEFKREHLS